MEYIVICLLPFIVFCMWAFEFILSGRYQTLSDKCVIMLWCVGAVIDYTLVRIHIYGWVDYYSVFLDYMEMPCALTIVPLYFICIRGMVHDAQWHKKYLWLFLPALVFGVANVALSYAVGWGRILEVRNSCGGRFIPEPGQKIEIVYKWMHAYLFGIVFNLMATILTLLCLWHLYRYYKKAENYYADLDNAAIGDINRFVICAVLLMPTSVVMSYIKHTFPENDRIIFICVSAGLAFLYFLLGKYAFRIHVKKSDLVAIADEDVTPELVQESDVSDNQLTTPVNSQYDKLKAKIVVWEQREDNPYCREGITLADVAKDMDVTPRVLSSYINTVEHMNFYSWINMLRIEKAKRIISNDTSLKFSYVAAVCGYADQAVFSKNFRRIEGISPNEYRESL